MNRFGRLWLALIMLLAQVTLGGVACACANPANEPMTAQLACPERAMPANCPCCAHKANKAKPTTCKVKAAERTSAAIASLVEVPVFADLPRFPILVLSAPEFAELPLSTHLSLPRIREPDRDGHDLRAPPSI